jgi:hypothetical protein
MTRHELSAVAVWIAVGAVWIALALALAGAGVQAIW